MEFFILLIKDKNISYQMHSPAKTNHWMTHADGNLWRQVVSDTYMSVFSWGRDSFQEGTGDNIQVVRRNRCLVWEKEWWKRFCVILSQGGKQDRKEEKKNPKTPGSLLLSFDLSKFLVCALLSTRVNLVSPQWKFDCLINKTFYF